MATGPSPNAAAGSIAARHPEVLTTGWLERWDFPGGRSGINRPGAVFLPPQYFDPALRDVRFPVVELITGAPGSPSVWSRMHVLFMRNGGHNFRVWNALMPTVLDWVTSRLQPPLAKVPTPGDLQVVVQCPCHGGQHRGSGRHLVP